MIPALLWVQISESLNTTSLQVVDTVLSGTENAALNTASSDSLNNAATQLLSEAVSTESGEGWWQWLLELKDTLSIPLFSLANTQVTLMMEIRDEMKELRKLTTAN